MDRENNHKAVNYIIGLIRRLLPGSQISVSNKDPLNYCFHISSHDLEVNFGMATMEDFQSAIEKYRNSDQYRSLEGLIKFRIYVALGQAGLIPKFIISRELLSEKRDWLKDCRLKFENVERLDPIFSEGLKKLHAFLSQITKEYGGSSEIKKEKEDIKHLIDYYNDHKTFNARGASEDSIGYLKAAAVCMILNYEKEKQAIIIPGILKEKDKRIYSVVAQLREKPFPQIKMPGCIFDYAEHVKSTSTEQEEEIMPKKELVFIACGQLTDREKSLGSRIEGLFTTHGINSFWAEAVNDLESLNSHIFKNLADCTGFIAIFHRRDGRKHETSVWINQEVGIAAFLRSTGRTLPSLILYEEGLQPEGLIKYTIANPPKFKTEEEALAKIEEWIKDRDFSQRDNPPEIDIILNEDRKQLGSMAGGGNPNYYNISYALSFRIRNKSDVNVCLENVEANNETLGSSKIDKMVNPNLTKLPLNIGARRTEKVNLRVVFPNETSPENKGKDFPLSVTFQFADRVITRELVAYL